MSKKYRYNISIFAEGEIKGTIDLTEEQAEAIYFASDINNWSSITKQENYSGSFEIDLDNPMEIPESVEKESDNDYDNLCKFLAKDYAKKYGLEKVENDMGETRRTRYGSIVFPNGWVASIVKARHDNNPTNAKYSVAMCDYNGYFDWEILNKHGAINGAIFCNTYDEVIAACEVIRNL